MRGVQSVFFFFDVRTRIKGTADAVCSSMSHTSFCLAMPELLGLRRLEMHTSTTIDVGSTNETVQDFDSLRAMPLGQSLETNETS
jgi:hypothetical protein